MKHMQPLKLLMVTAAIATPLCLMVSVPVFGAKPMPVCIVGHSHATIRLAIADTTCDSINVPSGTFYENVTITNRDVTIRGAGPGSTIVNGGGSDRVFAIESSTVTLKGMTITGGKVPAIPFGSGGGISIARSTLTVKDSVITGNEAGISGGGISSYNGTLIVKDSIITDNHAGDGGGIRLGSPPGQVNSLTVMDSVVAGNTATRWGGGIFGVAGGLPGPNGAPGTLTVKDSAIIDNVATQGGAIAVFNITLTVKDSDITGNTPPEIYP